VRPLLFLLVVIGCGTSAPPTETPTAPPSPATPAPPSLVADWKISPTGSRLGPAGDLDGDGFDDFWTAGALLGSTADTPAAVHVYGGSPSGPSIPPLLTVHAREGDREVSEAAALGDVNGDGCDDLGVVVRLVEGGARVEVIQGGRSGSTPGLERVGPEHYGLALAAGDLDGDGVDDLLVKSFVHDTWHNRIDWHRGSPTGLAPRPSREVKLADWDLDLGTGLSCGDLDGDGIDDLVVGLPSAGDREGRVQVHRGSADGPSDRPTWLLEPGGTAWFGFHVATADVTGDGVDDLLVGATPGRTGEGGLYVNPGGAGGPRVDGMWHVREPCEGLGCGVSISAGGDLDGDGLDDLLFLQTHVSGVRPVRGGLLALYSGGPSGLVRSRWSVTGEFASSPAAILGDLDGDGLDEVGFVPEWQGGVHTLIWRGCPGGPDEGDRSPDEVILPRGDQVPGSP
jgi:hypothetical protein